MKKILLGFISGVLVCVMVAMGIPAIAQTVSKMAEIHYKDIKIYIEDKEVVPKDANGNVVEPFIMDGTTYLPVRAVANALGLYVQWDASTNSAKLSTEELAPIAPTTPAVPSNPVVEAFKYEKNVINSSLSIAMGSDYSQEKHTISLPGINLQTANATAFNKKIENTFSDIVTDLKGNKEDGMMHRTRYEYKIHDGIVGIKVENKFGVQNGGAGSMYYFFYYDIINDKELTLNEYLKALGIDKKVINNALKEIPWYADEIEVAPIELIGCILDDKGSLIYYTSSLNMDGVDYYETKPII